MKTLETAQTHFEDRDVRFALRENHLHFLYEMSQGMAACQLSCYDEGFKLLVEVGPKCPKDRILALGRFVLAANYGLWGGRFDLDQESGHLCYAETVSFGPGECTDTILARLIGRGIHLWDRYLPGAMRVMFSKADALEMVAMCEAELTTATTEAEGEREWVEMMEQLMGEDEVDPDEEPQTPPTQYPQRQRSLWDEEE